MNRDWGVNSCAGIVSGGTETGPLRPVINGKSEEGRLDRVEFAGGLTVRFWDREQQHAGPARLRLLQGLTLVLLLKGELEFKLTAHNSEFAGALQEGCCCAAILDSPAHLQWEGRMRPLRLVQVSVTPEWLKTHCPEVVQDVEALGQAPSTGLPVWQAPPQSRAVARAILALAEQPAMLQRLEIEIQALSLVSHGLTALGRLASRQGRGSRRAHKVAAVQKYLDTHLMNPLNLVALGSQFGMSVSTLQRYFKQVTGVTVGDYVRQRRLQLAREQLLEAGATISEAAFIAGYSHTSNFITAYRRHFGHCPGRERASSPALLPQPSPG